MKRLAVLMVLLLTGCGVRHEELDRAMTFRAKLMASQGCAFDAVITADYGEELQEFSVSCQADPQGNLTFTVAKPESIAGISGTMAADGGDLRFDDKVLSFPLLAQGQVTPVSAPWLLVRTLLGGNVTACTEEDGMLRISAEDGFGEDALQVEIWLREDQPKFAEIVWQNRRILTLEIENFRIL